MSPPTVPRLHGLASAASVTIEGVLAQVDHLPTISPLAIRVGELVNDPRMGTKEIARVMQQDPSLCAKVLRLVNSSYFGIPGGVTDIARAISFVGFNMLYQLVLTVSVLKTLKTPSGATFDPRGLWIHSLAVGACAEGLARRINHPDPATCFTAGLLHDFGKIALAKTEGDRFCRALDQAQREGISMNVAEHNQGLPSHELVGSRLARKWKFPANLLLPIEHHHNSSGQHVRRDLASPLAAMVDIVSLADEICRIHKLGDSGSPAPEHADDAKLEQLGLSTLQLTGIHADTMHKLEKSKTFLDLLDAPPDK